MVHQGLSGARPNRRRALLALPWLGACTLLAAGRAPPLPREFRAAWVATVENIDWPSRPGLGAAAQRDEMRRLLDRAASIGLNALVLQVRPAADVIYPSALEPWSEVLSGTSGEPPDPHWDPLAEWVEGAHRRGLQLHAWFNPYRARHRSARSAPAAGHVAQADPAIVRPYGDQLWLDPGEARAADRFVAVVREVLQRYDVDGVHIDDYFYPYPAAAAGGGELDFPDDAPWQRYRAGGGALERAAWRRANVDRLVERLFREIRASRPWVRFGISPFGLPRPDRRPPGISGFSQYDRLHADVEHWLEQGWLDYLAPQLYWPVGQPGQSFPVLLQAWRAGNAQRRHLWPGLYTSRLAADEVLAQVGLSRTAEAPDDGHLHFSMTPLLDNRDGIADRLRSGPYAQPALVPATPWLAEPGPVAPRFEVRQRADGGRSLWPRQAGGPPLRQAVLWQRVAGHWRWQALALPAERPFELLPDGDAALLVGIGRSGLQSPARLVRGDPGGLADD